MDFTGKITFIGTTETVGQNETPKLSFVVEEVDSEYPDSIAFDLWKEKIELIKNFKVGDKVKVGMNFRAREYNGKYFNSVSAWKMQKLDGETQAVSPANDDLPF